MTGIEATDLDVLLGLLDLEQTGEDVFRGAHPPQTGTRTFGGQLVAQALVAAGRTTGDRPIHALNAHFIRGGNVHAPIEYRVARHRDGRDFANRMVTAYQGDEELFVMLAAYQKWGKGLEHAVTVPEVPYPEALPPIGDHLEGFEEHLPGFVNALKPIDMRYANDPAWILKGSGERLNHNRVWMRTDGELPDDPLLHVAALGYSSDTTVLDSILTTHGLSWGLDRIFAATANHSIWFHRPPRFDQWHLYATESPVAAGSRGLATGRYFDLDGELVATVVQEGIIKHFPSRR
ncbi:acyl-CoA thioesterase domain-containing protein [Rhodococcus zopfii]|uniref:acyl-CoA thioesterase II n=1 Tax=Rhodococcus zopfii TaxID=43772 RepID=UPI001111210E|nr:acyl-CoA thioesterase II [Rhodococcus zopfii]